MRPGLEMILKYKQVELIIPYLSLSIKKYSHEAVYFSFIHSIPF